jgi:hypothetical protein
MKRVLAAIGVSAVLAVVLAAEVRRDVPMDRLPDAEASWRGKDWWERTDIPSDHPYWWTLTDDVTPAELQRRIRERLLKLQLEAAEKLKRAAKAQSTDEAPTETAWIVTGKETPELFAVWSVLHSFGSGITSDARAAEKEKALIEFGVHPSAAAEIVGVAAETARKQTELWLETSKQQRRLFALLDEVERTHGRAERDRIFKEDDIDTLASLTGTPLEDVKEMLRIGNRDSEAAATIPLMVSLRRTIGEEQWQLLRRYLLLNQAPYRHESVIFRIDD